MKEITLMPTTDFLINAAKNGDPLALNQLVNQWHKRIYNFAYKYFHDYDMAMEVTQKTFISMHKNLKTLKGASSFKSWIYTIAVNYCHEEVRRQNRRWVFPFMKVQAKDDQDFIQNTETTHREENPDLKYAQTELKTILKRALKELPEEQRLVVIMKEYEGLKIREIATIIGISENTVKSRLYYALHSLKKLLELWNINQETIHYEL